MQSIAYESNSRPRVLAPRRMRQLWFCCLSSLPSLDTHTIWNRNVITRLSKCCLLIIGFPLVFARVAQFVFEEILLYYTYKGEIQQWQSFSDKRVPPDSSGGCGSNATKCRWLSVPTLWRKSGCIFGGRTVLPFHVSKLRSSQNRVWPPLPCPLNVSLW